MDDLTILEAGGSDELRELYTWLHEEPELRGWLRILESDPPEGALGPVAEAVQAVLDSPEAVATLVGVVMAWLRYRTGDVTIRIRRTKTGGEVELSAKRVKSLDADQTRALAVQIATVLTPDKPESLPGGEGDDDA